MISNAELIKYLNLLTPDEEVSDLVAQVIADFEQETHRLWKARTGYVELIEPDCEAREIYLDLLPVSSITTVEERDYLDTDWTTLTATDYTLTDASPRYAKLRRINKDWDDQIRITYDGGYTNLTAPEDMKQALLIQSKFMSIRTTPSNIAVKSQNFEGGAGVYEEADYHPYFKKIVKHYRRIY